MFRGAPDPIKYVSSVAVACMTDISGRTIVTSVELCCEVRVLRDVMIFFHQEFVPRGFTCVSYICQCHVTFFVLSCRNTSVA